MSKGYIVGRGTIQVGCRRINLLTGEVVSAPRLKKVQRESLPVVYLIGKGWKSVAISFILREAFFQQRDDISLLELIREKNWKKKFPPLIASLLEKRGDEEEGGAK